MFDLFLYFSFMVPSCLTAVMICAGKAALLLKDFSLKCTMQLGRFFCSN